MSVATSSLRVWFLACLTGIGAAEQSFGSTAVNESARAIPVAANVDVVVVGGSSAAVSAAVAARQAGASVFVLAPRPYLGEDLAGTLRLWLEKDEKATGDLAKSIFGTSGLSTPANLKKALDDALVAAKVDFLYSCYATDLLTDGAGKPCGVVMANRSGRQAVIAKVIIDATENGTVARLAGAKFSPFVPGPQTVKWVTIAKETRTDAKQTARKLSLPVDDKSKDIKGEPATPASWFEYTLRLDVSDGSWAARVQLEQTVRDQTYNETQRYSSDTPFMVPPTSIVAVHPVSGSWSGADQIALDAFRCEGIERLWVLGGCAGVPRDQADKLLRPIAFMEIGARIGAAAAAEVGKISTPSGVHVVRSRTTTSAAGEVKECADGFRPFPKPVTVQQDAGVLPILGSYDVVVVGGGTAGAPAGIGAARQGAKTLVIEYLHGLGGVGTLGMIGKNFGGNCVGFTGQIRKGNVEKRMEWFRRELRQSHGDLWFGVIGCGALVEGNRVTGVVVATPYGRGVVLAKAVVDATGNSDIPIAAGADYRFVDDPMDLAAVQCAHLAPRNVGAFYANGNQPATVDANPVNATRFFQNGLQKEHTPESFDRSQLIDSRERRRIVGDFSLDWLDIINKRTFQDSIEYARSSYDSHSGPTHVYFRFMPIPGYERVYSWHGRAFWAYVPYRCLLPKGLEGVLVVGLGMSADKNAMPIVRMQPDMENQGYAAGAAAAMAVKAGVTPRNVDIKALQRHLVEVGNLKADVLTHVDSYPLPGDAVKAAVGSAIQDVQGIEVVLAQPAQALPLLRQAHDASKDGSKINAAILLGMMGDSSGVPTLLEAAKKMSSVRDEKGRAVKPSTPFLLVIAALGYAGDVRAVPMLTDLLSQRSTADAALESLGRLGDRSAAGPLAEYLQKRNAAAQKSKPAKDTNPGFVGDLMAVWALWRCGDKDDVAKKALESIVANDNGLYAQLAWKLLNARPKAGQ